MTMNEYVTSFAGRPVADFREGDPLPDDQSAVAWRVAAWEENSDRWDYTPSPTFAETFESFLDTVDPTAVTALVIGSWGYAAMNDAPIEQLVGAASRLTNLRALFLGDILADECEISWIRQGDVTPLLAAYPGLEVLRLRGADPQDRDENGRLRLVPMRHDMLQELIIECGGLPGEVVRAIGRCDLPALIHLQLWLGIGRYGGDATVEDLEPILAGDRLPALRYLGLRDAQIADRVAAAVAKAPVVGRLHTLDLSLGTLSDEGAAALLAGQSLTHLRRLDLHHHYIGGEAASRLVAALPGVEVDLSDARSARRPDDRYVAVAE